MGFLQKFHLVIKYNKGSINNLVYMISQPPTSNIIHFITMMHMDPFAHDEYKEAYTKYEDFKEVYQQRQGQIHIEGDNKANYHFHNGLLYKLDKICVPKGEQLQLIREAHTLKVARHFGVGKKFSNLQRYVYWPRMKEDVAWYIRGCIICCTSNPSNRK
jgi:hypothetical protein